MVLNIFPPVSGWWKAIWSWGNGYGFAWLLLLPAAALVISLALTKNYEFATPALVLAFTALAAIGANMFYTGITGFPPTSLTSMAPILVGGVLLLVGVFLATRPFFLDRK